MVTDDRGQAFTLEGFVAALVLLASLLFALQATAVTPLSDSTASGHTENQQAAVASGFLDGAHATGTVGPALRFWNDTRGGFHDSNTQGYYTTCTEPLAFGDGLEQHFDARGLACNVALSYVTVDGDRRRESLVFTGTPTDNAVRAVLYVTLYDDDRLVAADGTPTNVTLTNASTFYAPDAAPDSPVYNVVAVEVVVWRT